MDNIKRDLKLAFVLQKTCVRYMIGYDNDAIIHHYTLPYEDLRGAETFLPHLQDTVKNLPSPIRLVTTHSGPGSITLNRIALSIAKGLSMGWTCPLYLPSRFDLINDFTIQCNQCLWTFNAYNGSFFTRMKKDKDIVDLGLLSTEQLTEFVNNHAIHHCGEWHETDHFKLFEEQEILFLFKRHCAIEIAPNVTVN